MDDAVFHAVIAENIPGSATIPRDVRDPGGVVVYNVGPEGLSAGLYASFTVEADMYRAAEPVDHYVSPIADYLQFVLAFLKDGQITSYVDYKSREPKKPISLIVLLDAGTGKGGIASIVSAMRANMGISASNTERSHSPRQKILSYVTACELFFFTAY